MTILKKNKFLIVLFLIGILFTFHKVIFSGFDYMPGSHADGRFINYILEHFYSWLVGYGKHSELFSPPNYYPLKNTLFYSDTLLSVAPLYILIRFFTNTYTAFALTIMCFFGLNYLSFYFLLKKINFGYYWSCIGAYLFAFSLLNEINLLHPQMLTQFFSIFAVLCLLNINRSNTQRKNSLLFCSASLLVVGQFYASYYLGFFLFFGSLLYLFIGLFFKDFRNNLVNYIKIYYKNILFTLIIILCFLIPLGLAYYNVKVIRQLEDITVNIKLFDSFFNSSSLIWGWKMEENFRYSEYYACNLGYLTLIVGFIGLFKFDKKFFIISIIVFLTLFNINDYFLVKIFYNIPGMRGIRFWHRVLFIVLPFITIGVINLLSKTRKKYISFGNYILFYSKYI